MLSATVLALSSGCAPQVPEHRYQALEAEHVSTQSSLREAESTVTALRNELTRVRGDLERAEGQRDANAELLEALEAAIAAQQALETPGGAEAAGSLSPSVEQPLWDFATTYRDSASYDRQRGALILQTDAVFDASVAVRSVAVERLAQLAERINQSLAESSTTLDVLIVGHTDDRPITRPEVRARHATNWHLAVHRAIALKSQLVRFGVPEDRVLVAGAGARRPTSERDGDNRRVEILLIARR